VPNSTGLFSKAENWDFEKERFLNNSTSNADLKALKENIEEAFNIDFGSGVIIDQQWMQNIIKKSFKRPNGEQKMHNPAYTIFLDDFAEYWLKNESKKWKNTKSKILTSKIIGQKATALKHFMEFQKKEELKIKLVDFCALKIKAFYDFLIEKEYAVPAAKKTLTDIKFFCRRANELKFNVNPDYNEKISFPDDRTKYDDIYLNETEISTIFNHDFSDSETLDIIRDNFILSLWTGKRISDLQLINLSNIIDGNLESIDKKTGALVKVPFHPQVQAILKKYYGNLPPKVNKDEYNIQIKEICRVCKIDAVTYGEVENTKKNRNVPGYYPKYKLVTSHTARRSFATNLSKVMSIQDVQRAGGWSSPSMVIRYNKETASEVADRVRKHFDNIPVE
jgi:integrase